MELPPLSPGIQARVMEEVEVVETISLYPSPQLGARPEDPPFPAGSTVTFELMLPRPAVVTAADQMWYCFPRLSEEERMEGGREGGREGEREDSFNQPMLSDSFVLHIT
ncbi:hypothetical protein EYF80_000983 [Liparis tanakae]|uniref:Uncharacterized protein n=1 Tax=Liparis tanakae TaxID=230148 RepID=A0A4Z2JF53_9TELE|nr:hypothetical protein EYF80_000983 [Liparis tanakae]